MTTNSSKIDLNELARQAQEGDQTAYGQLLRNLYPYIQGAIRKKLGSIVDQEDLTQECLMAIHKNLATYHPSQPLKPWVSAIIRYKLADHFRRLARKKEQLLGDDPIPVTESPFSANNNSKAPTSSLDVAEVLEQLPEKLRRAIELTHVSGLSYSEAAQKEGVSEVALRKRISRGFLRIRSNVAKEMEIGSESQN